ncbi:MAG: hypothetical protein PHD61_05860 [Bacteroidales bacterium]|nr:hypothetical protein [Bacteroidales bacterium]
MKTLLHIGSVIILILSLSVYAFSQPVTALYVTVTGSWTLNVPSVDLTEAGNNYAGTYTSAANQMLLSFTAHPPGHNKNITWSIDVHRQDATWDPSIQLWVRRTGNGTAFSSNHCTPSINGGLSYQQITATTSPFLSGTCQYSDIPMQYEIRNVSVLTPAQNYSTQVVYTVTITGL